MNNDSIDKEKNSKKEEARPQKLLVGIQYRPAGKIYIFETEDTSLTRGEWVVLEAEHGTTMGIVITAPGEISSESRPEDVRRVLRRANPEELAEKKARQERALEIFETFCKKIAEYNLPMKPLDAELVDGDKKVILTFFAEERVDFRSLVKELASILHLRIEMRQVGARDEVKCRGAMGVCGLITCCSLHLRQFQSISIQMAKTQGLTPNPAKLTGVCGKLKCCLAYENPHYAEIRQRLPRVGMMVATPRGEGKVVDLDILQEQCTIRTAEGLEIKVPASDVLPPGEKPKEEKKAPEGKKAVEKKEAATGTPSPRKEEGRKKGRRRSRGKSKGKGRR